jgi:hypothetical protein
VPDIPLPDIDINKAVADFNQALKDGAYIAIGLAVLAFQRAQVHRVEWAKQVEAHRKQFNDLSATLNSQAEDYAKAARSQAATARVQWLEQLGGLTKRADEVFAPTRAHVSKALSTDRDLARTMTEAGEALDEQLQQARAQLTVLAKAVDERVQPARQQLDEHVDRLEQYLPDSARTLVQSLRATAASQEQLWRDVIGLD